jgi:hypothetical protein
MYLPFGCAWSESAYQCNRHASNTRAALKPVFSTTWPQLARSGAIVFHLFAVADVALKHGGEKMNYT